VLLGLSGCAGLGPLDEKERARIRVVAPVAARFPPKIDFRLPPGKGETAALAGVDSALRAGQVCLYTGPFLAACLAAFGAAGAALGAALTPSTEKLELSAVERVHTEFRASDVQQFLAQRYSERVTRLTSLTVDPGATNHGPKSPEDIPSYGSVVLGENTVVAEVVVSWMNGSLEKDGEVWWLNISLQARMRLVRPTDGTTLSTRVYRVHRRGRPLQDYQQGGARPLQAITGAIDAAATLMVDDAFLLHSAGDVPELAQSLRWSPCGARGRISLKGSKRYRRSSDGNRSRNHNTSKSRRGFAPQGIWFMTCGLSVVMMTESWKVSRRPSTCSSGRCCPACIIPGRCGRALIPKPAREPSNGARPGSCELPSQSPYS
jgi:hypothetical protein